MLVQHLHETLAVTPDYQAYPDYLIDQLMAVGDSVSINPFPIALDRLSGTPASARNHRGSVALRSSRSHARLLQLSRELCAGMRYRGFLRPDWSCRPHTTLMYWQGYDFIRPVAPISWDAVEFVLIHSLLGQTRHIELSRWTLRSSQAAFLFG